jgi:ABC-2 type transport system ATP-binding protein
MSAIVVQHLTKTYRRLQKAGLLRRERVDVEAVQDVSFAIERGELVGYLGPNGAGKSTTIKMLTGILHPSGGSVQVAGLDPATQRARLARKIGVVFGQRSTLWWDLPLGDSFSLLRHIYGTDPARHRANVQEFCTLLDAHDLLAVPVRQLSLGQRMRGELIAALLHDPEVLFLDEPTVGLDVVSKHALREALATLNRERRTTIVLTTHDLADVERLCERVLIIDHGLVRFDDRLSVLKQRYGNGRVLVVELEHDLPSLQVAGLETFKVDGIRQWLRFDGETMTAREAIARVSDAAAVRDLTIEDPDIDDVVRRMYTE